MQIHAFSGFVSKDMKQSRTAGILAALLETYPQMTWDDVLAWAHDNGLDDWTPNLDTNDSQPNSVRLVGGDGFINFDERYPWTSEAQANFVQWANGYDIGKLPPIQTASPAVQDAFLSSQPAPAPVDNSMTDLDFFQQSQPDTTLQPAPMATPTPAATPAYTQSQPSPAPSPMTTPAVNPVSYTKPDESKKEGSSNMLLIVGGIIAVYMLMKRKK